MNRKNSRREFSRSEWWDPAESGEAEVGSLYQKSVGALASKPHSTTCPGFPSLRAAVWGSQASVLPTARGDQEAKTAY